MSEVDELRALIGKQQAELAQFQMEVQALRATSEQQIGKLERKGRRSRNILAIGQLVTFVLAILGSIYVASQVIEGNIEDWYVIRPFADTLVELASLHESGDIVLVSRPINLINAGQQLAVGADPADALAVRLLTDNDERAVWTIEKDSD